MKWITFLVMLFVAYTSCAQTNAVGTNGKKPLLVQLQIANARPQYRRLKLSPTDYEKVRYYVINRKGYYINCSSRDSILQPMKDTYLLLESCNCDDRAVPIGHPFPKFYTYATPTTINLLINDSHYAKTNLRQGDNTAEMVLFNFDDKSTITLRSNDLKKVQTTVKASSATGKF